MKTIHVSVVLLALTVSFVLESSAELVRINKSSFGSTTISESFEGVVAGNNVEVSPNGGLLPGCQEPYTFSSGLRLTWPIPNTATGYTQRINVRSGGDGFGLGSYGYINNAPFGDHYLIHAGGLDGSYELTMPTPASRIGGYWIGAGWGNAYVVVEAFGVFGQSLGDISIPLVNVSDWGNNFFGFESDDLTPISKIRIGITPSDASHPGVDMLMFESIPEPATLGLLSFGFSVLLRKRQI